MEGNFWGDVMAQFKAMEPSASGWDGGQQVVQNGQRYRSAATTQMNSDGTSTYTGGGDQYVSAVDAPWAQGQMGNLHDASGNVTQSWELEDPNAVDWQEKLILAGLMAGGAAIAGPAMFGGGAAAGGGAVGTGAGFVGEGALSGIGAWDAALAASPSWSAAGAGAAGALGEAAGGNGAFLGEAPWSATPGASPLEFGGAAAGGGVTPPNPFAAGGGGSANSLLGKAGAGAASLFGGGGGAGGGFDWTSLIGPATSLIGGAAGASAAGKAADSQLNATRESNALLERMFNKQVELQEPFRQGGMSGMNSLLDELGLSKNTGAANFGRSARDFGMSDFNADPGYGFRQQEGERALTRAASANGSFGSGKYLKDAMSYNSGLASQEYGNAFNRFQAQKASRLNPLQSLMGAGQTSANTMGQAAQNYGTGAASNINAGGDAKAAGIVGKANAWGNAVGQGVSMYQNQQQQNQNNMFQNALLNRYMGG